MPGYVQEIWQRNAHTVDTSTTHTVPVVFHVPGQVKCALDNFVMQTISSEKAAIDI